MPDTKQTVLEQAVADQWKVLPSGLTVLVRPMPGYSSTHVIFATKFGSIDRDFRLDGKEVHLPAGVAHFLEHKMFEDEDGDAFAKFAKTGANANAFTAFDRTCYLFTATEQLDESLDVLLGMVGHPYFTEQTIAKEQGIIGQEIKMYDDSPDWRLITGLFECLYHSHPIRSDIAGTVESIAEITPEMLYDSCRAFYAPDNMVLAAAGDTTMERVLAACARHGLMEPRSTERVQRLWTPEPMTLVTTETTLKMPVSKPCFGLGFKEEPLPEGDLRTEALYDLILCCIVGGMSPLYRRLYDEGLVNPGFGGQSFIGATLDKIRAVREKLDRYEAETGRRIALEVDGGIKPANIAEVALAGADTFVAGSAVFGAGNAAGYADVISRMKAAVAALE